MVKVKQRFIRLLFSSSTVTRSVTVSLIPRWRRLIAMLVLFTIINYNLSHCFRQKEIPDGDAVGAFYV